MARSIDHMLWAQWRERLGRCDSCGLTVVEFCRSEKVSQAAFYVWRKKLRLNSASDANPGARISSRKPDRPWPSTFLPVVSSVSFAARDSGLVAMTLPNGIRFELPAADHALVGHVFQLATEFSAVASQGVHR